MRRPSSEVRVIPTISRRRFDHSRRLNNDPLNMAINNGHSILCERSPGVTLDASSHTIPPVSEPYTVSPADILSAGSGIPNQAASDAIIREKQTKKRSGPAALYRTACDPCFQMPYIEEIRHEIVREDCNSGRRLGMSFDCEPPFRFHDISTTPGSFVDATGNTGFKQYQNRVDCTAEEAGRRRASHSGIEAPNFLNTHNDSRSRLMTGVTVRSFNNSIAAMQEEKQKWNNTNIERPEHELQDRIHLSRSLGSETEENLTPLLEIDGEDNNTANQTASVRNKHDALGTAELGTNRTPSFQLTQVEHAMNELISRSIRQPMPRSIRDCAADRMRPCDLADVAISSGTGLSKAAERALRNRVFARQSRLRVKVRKARLEDENRKLQEFIAKMELENDELKKVRNKLLATHQHNGPERSL